MMGKKEELMQGRAERVGNKYCTWRSVVKAVAGGTPSFGDNEEGG